MMAGSMAECLRDVDELPSMVDQKSDYTSSWALCGLACMHVMLDVAARLPCNADDAWLDSGWQHVASLPPCLLVPHRRRRFWPTGQAALKVPEAASY